MNGSTYLMPIRRRHFDVSEAKQLQAYLSSISSALSDVLVIDGSPDAVFSRHHELWNGVCRHERVDPAFTNLNDKVNGIQTGVRLARDKIILADDDIRYTVDDIRQVAALLDDFEVVRPQNYFDPKQNFPWWARLEAARMLINRATLRTGDYPGTCAFRRETMLRCGAYDGDVLFDNEELIRHLVRCRATITYANDLFIRKRPPTLRKWIEQRPRQAYEDFGLRTKTVLFAAIAPFLIVAGIFAGPSVLAALLLAIAVFAIGLAAMGRARGHARRYFPASVCFIAPFWILERTLSTYWAFYWFLRRGGYPFGDRLLRKGIGYDWVEGGRIASQMASVSDPPK